MKTSAEFSPCRTYRYVLWRVWDDSKSIAMFIGLNPSTADEVENDPTVTRCVNFAKDWGYGGLCMTNLFAYRETNRHIMKIQREPIGPENDKWLIKLAKEAEIVVAAWGNDGKHLGRSDIVRELIPTIHHLALNKTGEPSHPLYLKGSLTPQSMNT